jgi:sulfur carrier protein ThiS
MLVEVRVFSGLERFLEKKRFGEPFSVEIQEGSSLRDLLEQIGIPEDQVFTTLIDGKHRETDYILNEGERVSLFPPVGGG